MISEKELEKNIQALERWMLGDGNFKKLDCQLVYLLNVGDRISAEKKMRALLLWIMTGKYQEVEEFSQAKEKEA